MGTRRVTAFRLKAAAAVAGFVASGTLMYSASYAAFTSTTSDGANNWAVGSVIIADNDAGVAMFDTAAANGDGHVDSRLMKPGDILINYIKVTYTGTLAANVHIYAASLNSNVAPSLTPWLHVKIEESDAGSNTFGNNTGFAGGTVTTLFDATHLAGTGPGGTPVADDYLQHFPTTYVDGAVSADAAWVTNDVRYYKYTITLDAAAPDSVQSGTATAIFKWEARNN